MLDKYQHWIIQNKTIKIYTKTSLKNKFCNFCIIKFKTNPTHILTGTESVPIRDARSWVKSRRLHSTVLLTIIWSCQSKAYHNIIIFSMKLKLYSSSWEKSTKKSLNTNSQHYQKMETCNTVKGDHGVLSRTKIRFKTVVARLWVAQSHGCGGRGQHTT